MSDHTAVWERDVDRSIEDDWGRVAHALREVQLTRMAPEGLRYTE